MKPNRSEDDSCVPDKPQAAEEELNAAPENSESSTDGESVADMSDELLAAQQSEVEISDDLPLLRKELDQAQARALRLQAELENYRKRTQRTLDEERRFAALPLMRDILGVLDNLQRAIAAAQQTENTAGLLDGVKMVLEQLIGILKRHDCQEIPAQGTAFDPHLHEAIAQFPSEEHEPGTVTQVAQTGYQLHGRVIRPAQVIVAAARPEGA